MDISSPEQESVPVSPVIPVTSNEQNKKRYIIPFLLFGVSIFSILFGLSIGYVVGMNQSAAISSPTPSITPTASPLPTQEPTRATMTPTENPVAPTMAVSAVVTSVPDEGKPNVGSCTTHADCGGGGCNRCQDSRCVNVCNNEP